MAVFIETIVVRHDGRTVTTRQRARNLDVANRLAYMWANGFQPVEMGCFCPTCSPVMENDLGERMTVQVNEYSPEARVKEGLFID